MPTTSILFHPVSSPNIHAWALGCLVAVSSLTSAPAATLYAIASAGDEEGLYRIETDSTNAIVSVSPAIPISGPFPLTVSVGLDYLQGNLYGTGFTDSPDGRGQFALVRIDPVTGVATPIGPPNPRYGFMHGLAGNAVDLLSYYIGAFTLTNLNQTVAINPVTTVERPLSPLLSTPAELSGLAFRTVDQHLYGVSKFDNRLHRFDPETGSWDPFGAVSFGIDLLLGDNSGLAYDPESDRLFLVTDIHLELFAIHPATGVAQSLGDLSSNLRRWSGLATRSIPGTAPTLALLETLPEMSRLTLTGTPLATYAIESSSNLAQWTYDLSVTLPADGGPLILTTSHPIAGFRFFRARAL
jgi:hypothetical protein